MKKFGFLAMMNPGGANKPPPAFIRRTLDPTFAAQEQKEMKTLEMTENTQMDKPIMKRKKRRGKAKVTDFDDKPAEKKELDPIVEDKEEAKETPVKQAPPQLPPVPEKKEVEKPKMPALPPKEAPKPAPVAKADPPKPAAKKPGMAFLDSDSDEEDMFAKKPPASPPKPAETAPPVTAAPAASKKMAFLDSDSDDDQDDDSFD